MIGVDSVSGLILSGGRSSRMQPAPQGRAGDEESAVLDKGLLRLNGRPLVAFCKDNLEPWVGDIYISANRFADVYGAYGTVVPDDPVYGESQGPLVGIASVLALIRTPWLCVLPVDSPVVPPRMAPRLMQALQDGRHDIAYVMTDRTHPLCMLIHVACLPALRAYLLSGGRRVHGWLMSQRSLGVDFSNENDKVWNVNTPADLEDLRAYVEAAGGAPGQASQSASG